MERMNGQAVLAQSSGDLSSDAASFPSQSCNMGVLISPGSNGTQVNGSGSSRAIALERPSMAHLEAQ